MEKKKFTTISKSAKHFIRDGKITLTEEEFNKRAKKYVSLLFEVFTKWVEQSENDSGILRGWNHMNDSGKDSLTREFFELYLQ